MLTGLTSLTYRDTRHAGVDVVRAIAQLTRLRSLSLQQSPSFSDVQLAQLSTLSRLTNLAISGDDVAATASHIAIRTLYYLPPCYQATHDPWAVPLHMPGPAKLTRLPLLSTLACR